MELGMIPDGLDGQSGLLALPTEILQEIATFLVKRFPAENTKFYNYTTEEVDRLRRAHPELDQKLRYVTYRAYSNDDSIMFGFYATGKDLGLLPKLSIESCLQRQERTQRTVDRRFRGVFDVCCSLRHKMALHVTGLQAACIMGDVNRSRILLGLGANPNTMCDVSALVLALERTKHQPRAIMLRAMAQDGGWMVNCAFLVFMFGEGANSPLVSLMHQYGCVPVATRGSSFFNTIGGTVIDEAAHNTSCECESGMRMADLFIYRLPVFGRLDHVSFGDTGAPRLYLHNMLASNGDFESLKQLVVNKPPQYLDSIDASGRPTLYWAIHAPEEFVLQTIDVVLATGVNVNYTEASFTRDRGETPLHWICKRSDISIERRLAVMEKLILHGADPMAPGRPGPMHAPDSFFMPLDALVFPRSRPTWKCQFHSIVSHEGFRCTEAFNMLWSAIRPAQMAFNEILFVLTVMRAVALVAPVHSCIAASAELTKFDLDPRNCRGVGATLPERQLMSDVAECRADADAGEVYVKAFLRAFGPRMMEFHWNFVDAAVRQLLPDEAWVDNVSPFYRNFFKMEGLMDEEEGESWGGSVEEEEYEEGPEEGESWDGPVGEEDYEEDPEEGEDWDGLVEEA